LAEQTSPLRFEKTILGSEVPAWISERSQGVPRKNKGFDEQMHMELSRNRVLSDAIRSADVVVGIPVYKETSASVKKLVDEIRREMNHRGIRTAIVLGGEPDSAETLLKIKTRTPDEGT